MFKPNRHAQSSTLNRSKVFKLTLPSGHKDLSNSETLNEIQAQLLAASKIKFHHFELSKMVRVGQLKQLAPQLFAVEIALEELKRRSDQITVRPQLELTASDIVFEDDVLVVVKKPVGIASQPTLDPSSDSMVAAMERFLKRRDPRVSYLALHHRLDVDTSGLLLFCRKKSFNKAVGDLFSERRIEKNYLAVVAGQVERQSFRVQNYLAKSPSRPLRAEVVKNGGQLAITDFEVINRSESQTLLKCVLKTGRFHQIRIHLASQGHPIVGDQLYGGPGSSRLMLHSYQLKFLHPKTGQEISIESPAPNFTI